MITAAFIIAMLLVIWFDTDAFVEYVSIMPKKAQSWLKVDAYKIMGASENLSYPEFLVEYYNCFLSRLLSCEICIAVQLSLLFTVLSNINQGWMGFIISPKYWLPTAFLSAWLFYILRRFRKKS